MATGIKNYLGKKIEQTNNICKNADKYIQALNLNKKLNIIYGSDSKRNKKSLIKGEYKVIAIFRDKFHLEGKVGIIIVNKNDIVDGTFKEI